MLIPAGEFMMGRAKTTRDDEVGMRFVDCPTMPPPQVPVGPPGPGDFHPVDPVEPDLTPVPEPLVGNRRDVEPVNYPVVVPVQLKKVEVGVVAIKDPVQVLLSELDHAPARVRLGWRPPGSRLPLGRHERDMPTPHSVPDDVGVFSEGEGDISLAGQVGPLQQDLGLGNEPEITHGVDIAHVSVGTRGRWSLVTGAPVTHPRSSYGTRDEPSQAVPAAM